MGITLIDNFSIIAHSQHENQSNDALAKWLIVIPYVQYLSLLLPAHGWNLWSYKDGYLGFFQKAASYSTITPFFEFQSSLNYYPFTIFTLIVMLSLFLYLSFISLQSERDNQKHQDGRSSTLSSIMLFAIQTLQIPCYKFYCPQILFGQTTQLVVNIIALILYCSLVFLGEFFFRQYSFIPFHPMQQKFTKLRVFQFILNLIIIVLELENQTIFQNIIALSLLHSIFIFKMLNHLYFKPDNPERNTIHFKISFVLEAITTLISINVMSSNTIIDEKQLAIYMLFVSSLCFAFGNSLFEFLSKFNQDSMVKQLYQIYELYFYINKITNNSITMSHLKVYQIINGISYQSFCSIQTRKKKYNSIGSYYKLGLSLINEVFIANKKIVKKDYEELHLLYISYLAQIKNKPLIAYVEFKKYKNDILEKSFYFKFIGKRIDFYLQGKILQIQQQFQKNMTSFSKTQEADILNTHEIYEFYHIKEEFISKVLELAEIKIKVWELQIKGSRTMYEYEAQSSTLSVKIIECIYNFRRNKIFLMKKNFVQKCENILTLKLASIFNSFILNDYFASLACEIKIQELMKSEICSEQITKTSVIQDQTILVVISIVKQFGQIVSNNKSLSANYFNYNLEDFQHISNINQLMPRFFGVYHNQLLENYVRTAQTSLEFERRLTFSLDQQGYLIPQYLNLYVNFDEEDDFKLIGCLTKINTNSNYLIFDEFGKLIGITEHLCRIMIPQKNLDLFLDNIESFYIYMFMPHIHAHMNSILTNTDNHVLQKQVLVYIYQNLAEVQKIHQQIVLTNYQMQTQTERTKIFTNSQNDLENLLTNAPNSNQNRFSQYLENQSKQVSGVRDNEMIDFLNSLETLNKVMFFCTAKIQLASFGKKSQKLNYFILELSEFVEKTLLQYEEKKQKKMEILQWKDVKRNSKVRSSFLQQSQQMVNSREFQYDQNLLSPSGSVAPHRKSLLNKSPQNNQILDYINDRRSILITGKEKSESFSEEQLSYDVYELMKNQQNEYQSNQGVKIIKSQSSNRSGNSGVAAVEIVNQFTKQTSFISSLTIISLIKCLVCSIFLIFLFINLAQIQSFNDEAKSYITDINLPVNLNKDFLNVFSFAWIYGLKKLKIISYSKFIENQMADQFQRMQSTFSDLTTMYKPFINLEEKGFLENLQIQTFESTTAISVDYTYYINYLQEVGYQLMYAPSTSIYLNNLLKFRGNFDNILRNNNFVIFSLNSLYSSQQSSKTFTLFRLILIEIIVLNLILVGQIFFWFKIEQYCQKVLLLTCRLTEQAAEEQMLKFRVISTVLKQEFGESSWKQQNSHNLCYTNYSKYNKFKTRQSKIITTNQKIIQQYVSKVKNTSSRSSKSLPLNSRIQDTTINISSKIVFVLILVILLSLYIIGDYLLFTSQSAQLEPTQNLIMNYIKFLTNFDNSIGTACIAKSEQQIYAYMSAIIPERADVIALYQQKDITANIISRIYSSSNNNTDLNDIYQGVIDSDLINGEDEQYSLSLYNDDFCLLFTANQGIPFCDKKISNQEFIQLYGAYDSKDNNTEYLSRGIMGVVANFRTFIQQQFEYEYTNSELNPNITLLQQQMQTQQFNNIIIQHYLDTYLGLEAFFNRIQKCIISSIAYNMLTYSIYQYILGSILFAFFIGATCYYIFKVNLRLICLRLLITQLPIEIMLHIYTISLLKILK